MSSNPSRGAAIERDVRRFLAENFPLGRDGGDLDVEDSLVEAGLLDSTGVLELVGYVETQFGIEVADEDLIPENFDSIGRITRYVMRKL